MGNPYFQFKQFTVYHDRSAMKVTTDGCLFGSYVAYAMLRDKEEKETKERKVELGMKKVLDVGCGMGLLGLMVVQKNEGVMVDAVEVDKEAAEQARENVEASPWRERIRVMNEDVLKYKPGYAYDYIVCNPPFYENEIRSGKDARDTAHHSEQLTLEQVLNVIVNHLKENGLFYLLLPGKREKELERLMKRNNMILKRMVILHLSKTNTRIIIEGIGRRILNDEGEEEEIWVGDERFKELMKDYYLNA